MTVNRYGDRCKIPTDFIQAASYGLLAAEDRRDVHWKISKFLQQPDIVENFIFEGKIRRSIILIDFSGR
jgi:hypothetical protein